jgi:hypothetical protein
VPGAGWCRRMLCQTGISRVSSSKRIGLGRPLLRSVGVKIGVKGSDVIGTVLKAVVVLSLIVTLAARSENRS